MFIFLVTTFTDEVLNESPQSKTVGYFQVYDLFGYAWAMWIYVQIWVNT